MHCYLLSDFIKAHFDIVIPIPCTPNHGTGCMCGNPSLIYPFLAFSVIGHQYELKKNSSLSFMAVLVEYSRQIYVIYKLIASETSIKTISV